MKMSELERVIRMRNIKKNNLAKQLGISKAAVSSQAKHGIKSLNTAKRYAEILECNPFFLLD